MVLSRKRVPLVPKTTLKLNNQVLEQVNMYKYPGILISKDLSWSPHIIQCVQKLARSLACCTGDPTNSAALMHSDSLYITCETPSRVCLSSLGSLHPQEHTCKWTENVQKFACKMASCQWNGVQYIDLLSITNLPSLKRRTEQSYATCSNHQQSCLFSK